MDVDKMKVAELRRELARRDLSADGKRDALRKRLRTALAAETGPSTAAENDGGDGAEPAGAAGDGAEAAERPAVIKGEVLTCPGCKARSVDSVVIQHKRQAAVYCYSAPVRSGWRIRYCKCRVCGRFFKRRRRVGE